ncbi:MAG: hypothetical protein J5769_01325 [Bacteroidales bacterium]|nr:hypothetical protein [Bacteroidales bacterium]
MKRTIVFLLTAVFVSLSAISCNPKEDPSGNGGETGLKPGTFKFVASAMKGTWQAGDKIYVHGALGSDAEIITLGKNDISSDGKTASVKLDKVTNTPLEPDGLYALWPDECVTHSMGILGTKYVITQCDTLISAAYLDGDTFTFVDASSAVTFTVNGYDGYAFGSNNSAGVNVTKLEVNHSSAKTSFVQKGNDGYPYKYGSVKSGEKITVWFAGNTTLTGGYTLYFSRGGIWTATYKVSSDVTLTAGKPLELGDITAKLTPYDGPAPKMPKMGEKTKYAVKFNELSGICLSKDEDFLWGVGDDGSIAKLSFTGEVLYEKWIGCDLEAVSRNPETEDLIVGIEDEYNPSGSGIDTYSYNGVGRILSPNFNKVEGLYRISAANKYNNAGVEGVTYYKDGYILAGTQANSHLFCIKYETGEVLWSEMLYDKDTISEIADLCYDPKTGWLWIMDSENKKFFATVIGDDHKVNILCAYSVSEIANPESVCVDHRHSCIWVGDDYCDTSYLYKYEFTGLDDANIIPSIE